MDTSSFGVELRRARVAAGLSLSEFAKLVNYSKGYLSKIETGVMPPTIDLARRCDAQLDAGGTLARLREDIPRPPSPEHGSNDELEAWAMVFGADGMSMLVPVRRRDMLLTGSAVALGGLVGPSRRRGRSFGGAEVITAYRDMFVQTRRFGWVASPESVLPHVIAQTHSLRVLAEDSRGAQRNQLYTLAARYAEYTGWMAQETGDARAALWWTDVAVRMAEAGSDHSMATYALTRRALIALNQQDSRSALALSAQAQADPRAPVRVRELAAQEQAQAHALAGESTLCRHALDRAEELAHANADEDSELMFGSSAVPDALPYIRAWCLHNLGRPAEAAQILGNEAVPPTAVRTFVRYATRRALAHAAAGEVEQACAVTTPLLAKVRQVRSGAALNDLRLLNGTLRRWPRHPAVAQLGPDLVATLRPSVGV